MPTADNENSGPFDAEFFGNHSCGFGKAADMRPVIVNANYYVIFLFVSPYVRKKKMHCGSRKTECQLNDHDVADIGCKSKWQQWNQICEGE